MLRAQMKVSIILVRRTGSSSSPFIILYRFIVRLRMDSDHTDLQNKKGVYGLLYIHAVVAKYNVVYFTVWND